METACEFDVGPGLYLQWFVVRSREVNRLVGRELLLIGQIDRLQKLI